ncbi:MAG TPA: DUF4124 domain-containing protein [Desulfosarcina sp.]|nr:DUF4124 domain-containing protein [Desulfosarcina sp.]
MRLKFQIVFWALMLSCSLGSSVEAGAVYEWIDKDGTRHFTDGPPPPGARLVEGLSDTQSGDPTPAAGPADDGNTGAAEEGESAPNDAQDAGAVEDGDPNPAGRDAFWRNRGWGNAPPNPEGTDTVEDGERAAPDNETTGAVEDAEKDPANPEDATPAENGEKDPVGNDDQWRSRGW